MTSKPCLEYDSDYLHTREYNQAVLFASGLEPPIKLEPWDKLSDGQRESIRQENKRWWAEMNALAEGLAAL